MFTRILITFLLFAGLAYYFNVDVRVLVDKSGVPKWLSSHGIGTNSASTTDSSQIEESPQP